MPCSAPPRGFTDTIKPWSDAINNNPCGKDVVAAVGGVDVSAQNLCLPHYTMKYGQSAVPKGVMGGIDASTVFCFHADSLAEVQGHPLTAFGDAKIDTAQSKFGGSALLLDGTGDYLSTPDSPDWDLGSGDFTIDFWLRINALGANQQVIGQWTGAGAQGAWFVQISTGGNLIFAYTTDGSTFLSKSFAWGAVASTWYHVAIVRSGDNLMAFVNGTQIGTTQSLTGATIFSANAVLTVGGNPSTGQYSNGWLDEIRISRSVARWTSTFTPPTAPYT